MENINSNNTIRVAALTAGVKTPSTRFRMRQYFSRLAEDGVIVKEHIPFFEKSCGLPSPLKAAARIPALFSSRSADVVWIGKELVQGYETFERLLKRPRIMDVDDAIWLNPPLGKFAVPRIARKMDAIIAGNSFLAEYFSRYCKNIHILPTAIELDRYKMRAEPGSEPSEKFVIGWTGLACNYKYLKSIEPVLGRFLRDHDRAEVKLISNRPWKYKLLPPGKVSFVSWMPENETTALHSFSVGIMPLSDDKWARGKCSFKMLQYMAVGLPVIASPVGMNAEVLQKGQIGYGAVTGDQWYQGLESLYNDWSLQVAMGRGGRKVVEEFYNADIISTKLAGIFKSICGR